MTLSDIVHDSAIRQTLAVFPEAEKDAIEHGEAEALAYLREHGAEP